MSHGVLAMADKSIFTQGFTHQQRVTAHWVTQAIALILITIAQSAIYINKTGTIGLIISQLTASLDSLHIY